MVANKFDVEALHKKYLEERDKRIKNGDRSSIDPIGMFADFDRDPWAPEVIARNRIVEDVDVVMTGAGLAALEAAAHLTKAGIVNIRLIDIAGDFGGVWYWNRYPGVRCDIESYVYLPLLEEVGTVPKEKYSAGKEIFEHAKAIGRHFNLYEKAIFQTKITESKWDDHSCRWHVKTNRGDLIRTRFLIGTSGYLQYPKFPNIPGIKDFRGKMFHPSRWDFKYTGGDSGGELVGLKGKRVALIGTGATGIQILPHLARHAEAAYLFQRTPAAVGARNNRLTDVEWFRSQNRGWQEERMRNFHAALVGMSQGVDLVDDCWTQSAGRLFAATTGASSNDPVAAAKALQLYDYEVMQGIRDLVDRIVKDPRTAESLKAWYNMFCRRPLYADDYIQCFNERSVKLIDTEGRGVERITETGLIANGQHYEVDCIVIASGFQVGAYQPNCATFPIIGRTAKTLAEKWAHGVSSVHGLWTHDFPNFQVVGTIFQAGVSFNYLWLAHEHAIHAAAIISRALSENVASIEVTAEAEARWNEKMIEKAQDTSKFNEECTPSYLNNEGDASSPSIFNQSYGGGAFEYFNLLRRWRDSEYKMDTVIKNMPECQ
jgi:cation diffusion facilitator CzcD-associated flavoprotein CzcO